MKAPLILASLLFMSAGVVIGQTYQAAGRITDSITGLPVPGAIVEVVDASTGSVGMNLTDANGMYGGQSTTAVGQQPVSLLLGAPSPNPVMGVAAIQYAGTGVFVLYDLRGRTLLKQELAGDVTLRMARELPAGTYIYALQSGNRILAARKFTTGAGLRQLDLLQRDKIADPGPSDREPTSKTQAYPTFVFINVEADGFVPKRSMTVLYPDHVTARDYVLAPVPTTMRVHGMVADHSCATPMSTGFLAIRTEDDVVHSAVIQPDGTFDITVDRPGDEAVDVWLGGVSGFCGDTFTLCKMNLPSALGVTASCVSVYEPDTLTTSLAELAYPSGHYVLALEEQYVSMDSFRESVSGRYHRGVAKWESPSIQFVKILNQYPNKLDPIPTYPGSSIDRTIDLLSDQFETPLGLRYVTTVTADSLWYDWGAEPFWESDQGPDYWDGTAYMFFDSYAHVAHNLGWPAEIGHTLGGYPFLLLCNGAGVSFGQGFSLYLSEITESMGVMDDYATGSNHFAFEYDDTPVPVGFSDLGLAIWSAIHTYTPGSFAFPGLP